MTKNALPLSVFLAGLAAICWIGAGYAGSSPLGLLVTGVIGACYLAGAHELHRYRQASASLRAAVAASGEAQTGLADWLQRVDPGLRNAVRLRIEGERAPLPAPVLTPYLVGLLVLLGMLGTLLGMMATLRGTGIALESGTDLQALRDGLAAPVKGLAFAFGTSIAGVAASAMLGLLSALCRRERLQAVQLLDVEIAASLRPHSQAWQREETFRLMQQQAALMPQLVERLQDMVAAIERQAGASGERLAASQHEFHARSEAAHARLADALQASLRTGMADSAQALHAALEPAVERTLAGLSTQAQAMHEGVVRASEAQLEALVGGIASRLEGAAAGMGAAWSQALARQEAANDGLALRNEQALVAASAALERQATALVAGVDRSHAELKATLAEQDAGRLEQWSARMEAIGQALRQEWEQAGARSASQQQAVCQALERSAEGIAAQSQAHASATIAEISRLVDAAAEAPRAAAEVVAELRQKLSDSMVRDTAMLEERTQLIGTLGTLLDAVNHASTEQRGAIDALVSTSAGLLEQVGNRFAAQVQDGTGTLETAAAQVAAGAVEVASLGDAFGEAVRQFGRSSDDLAARLQAIEGALERSLVRSDEQLAYYVAQAREVIDLSLLSQKQIVADLRQAAANAGGDAGADAA